MKLRGRPILVAFRFVSGSLAAVAIVTQLAVASQKASFAPANFFGYFTILSNAFAASVLLYAATRTNVPSRGLGALRGAATLAMVVVGVVFSILLANLESDVIPWVNVVLHYVMPIVVFSDWLLDPPRTQIGWRDAITWLAFPLVYITYTLVRGAIVHWYPYPFLDADSIGYPAVAAYVCGIFIFALVVATIVRAIANARSRSMRHEVGRDLPR